MMLPENDRAVEKLERSGDHAKLNLRQREGCWGGWGWDAQKDLSSKGMKLARKGKEEEREIGLFCCRIVPTVGWKCKGRANEFDWFAMCHANWGEGVGKHGKWNGVGMMWNGLGIGQKGKQETSGNSTRREDCWALERGWLPKGGILSVVVIGFAICGGGRLQIFFGGMLSAACCARRVWAC